MATVTIEINNQTSYQLKVASANTNGKWQTMPQGYIEENDSASFPASAGDSLRGQITFTPHRGIGSYEVKFETLNEDLRTATRVPSGHTQEVVTTGLWPDFGLSVVFR
jgi:hypothetical protein